MSRPRQAPQHRLLVCPFETTPVAHPSLPAHATQEELIADWKDAVERCTAAANRRLDDIERRLMAG